MKRRPLTVLDLYCGAGGASVGYAQAGFVDIVGVDIDPQPNYPYTFIQADISDPDIEFDLDLFGFDLIHASPPCQVHSTLRETQSDEYLENHVDLVDYTRDLLLRSEVPYVIENVVGAPLHEPIRLCGTSFGCTIETAGHTWELRRHRLFETSFDVWAPPPCCHQHKPLGIYGDLTPNARPNNANRRPPFDKDGNPTNDWKAGHEDAKTLMGIDWMTTPELVQAIPPAYTNWIGTYYQNEVLGLTSNDEGTP